MRSLIMRTGFGLLFGVLLTCVLAFAQISGDLLIQVTDSSGATVPNATVALTNKETGSTRTITTGSDGTARFSQLDGCSYTVKVETAGFTQSVTSAAVSSG